jgi:membrane protease YdiL (CAAX protease family)
MDSPAPGTDSTEPPLIVARPAPTPAERAAALIEVLLCSDYPTQIGLAATFAALGFRPDADGSLNLGYVAGISLLDSVLLIALIVFFLRMRGESPADVFFGGKPIGAEARAGVPLLFVAFGMTLVVLLGIQALAPWLHTVARNPLQDLVRSPADAAMFTLVLIVAGGVREEVQRAFLLRRFERWLGGARVGLVVSSVAFGAGHFIQGADAAIATALLGAFWGTVYLRRRSIAAPVVSHAGFNLVQILQYLVIAR